MVWHCIRKAAVKGNNDHPIQWRIYAAPMSNALPSFHATNQFQNTSKIEWCVSDIYKKYQNSCSCLNSSERVLQERITAIIRLEIYTERSHGCHFVVYNNRFLLFIELHRMRPDTCIRRTMLIADLSLLSATGIYSCDTAWWQGGIYVLLMYGMHDWLVFCTLLNQMLLHFTAFSINHGNYCANHEVRCGRFTKGCYVYGSTVMHSDSCTRYMLCRQSW